VKAVVLEAAVVAQQLENRSVYLKAMIREQSDATVVSVNRWYLRKTAFVIAHAARLLRTTLDRRVQRDRRRMRAG
jgi:hypothetical protein